MTAYGVVHGRRERQRGPEWADQADDQRAAVAAEALPMIEAETEARRRAKQAATRKGEVVQVNSPEQVESVSGNVSRKAAAEQFRVSEHKVRQADHEKGARPTPRPGARAPRGSILADTAPYRRAPPRRPLTITERVPKIEPPGLGQGRALDCGASRVPWEGT